jgi:hypothetical protein
VEIGQVGPHIDIAAFKSSPWHQNDDTRNISEGVNTNTTQGAPIEGNAQHDDIKA